MEIQYGSKVEDKDGNVLGSVNRVIKNSWSGDVSKFVVAGNDSGQDLFLSPADVLEVTDTKVKLKINIDKDSGDSR
jgi:hypothetical protein